MPLMQSLESQAGSGHHCSVVGGYQGDTLWCGILRVSDTLGRGITHGGGVTHCAWILEAAMAPVLGYEPGPAGSEHRCSLPVVGGYQSDTPWCGILLVSDSLGRGITHGGGVTHSAWREKRSAGG